MVDEITQLPAKAAEEQLEIGAAHLTGESGSMMIDELTLDAGRQNWKDHTLRSI